jgi:O-antigen/teichoic acid export membrane protein
MAGVAHAVANLLLARQLPVTQFAYVALFLAFLDFGAQVGTAGADTIVVRHRLGATRGLLIRVLMTAGLVGLLVYVAARYSYGFDVTLALITTFAVVAGAFSKVTASIWQSLHRFRAAVFQAQSSHLILALLAVAAIVLGWKFAVVICAMHAAYFAIVGSIGWHRVARLRPRDESHLPRYPWRECAPIIIMMSGMQLAMQTERFLIPHLLQIEELATYGVLAAVVGSPFQVLSFAVGYTLLPRLAATTAHKARMHLIRAEVLITTAIILAAAVVVLLLAPWVVRLFVGDKFVLTTPLIATGLLIGMAKVAGALFIAIVKAVGTATDLNRLSVIAWLGLAISIAAAWPMSHWGLPGLLMGVAIGWAARALFSLGLALQVLRREQFAT